MWRIVLGAASLPALGYIGYDYYYRSLLPYPVISRRELESKDHFLIYKPTSKVNLSHQLSSLGLQVYTTRSGYFDSIQDKIKFNETSTGLYFVRNVNGKFFTTTLEAPEKLEKWVKRNQNMYSLIKDRQSLLNLLKKRSKHEFLDMMILAYIPEDDLIREEKFKELIANLDYGESLSAISNSYGFPFINFYKITDKTLAEELKIDSLDKMTFLKIKDSRGWFHSQRSKTSYVDVSKFKNYVDEKLATEYKINGHELQLDLQIYFDRFELTESEFKDHQYKSIEELSKAISSINPLILPLFSFKQLQITLPKVAYSVSKENSKMLVVSLKKNHEEKNLNEIQAIFHELKIEEFARNHPDIPVIIGYPEFIYHLNIKDLALYHYENIEVRLFDIHNMQVVNSINLDQGMHLNDLLEVKQSHMETSPPSTAPNAEILSPEELYDNVLKHTNRCYFLMNCSKTCPACSYQDIFFQQAALLSNTCKFVKYYVSNQSPYYKGPNSTPRYYLYVPGKTEPVIYEPKHNGLNPENFISFINSHLSSYN
jgi:hypothetical protein